MTRPVYEITFQVNANGRDSETPDFVTVKDAESLMIAIDGNVEEWNPMDTEGWKRRMMTAKSLTVTMGGKRNSGDAGNDYVASLAYANGEACNSQMKITFPDGATLDFDCVIDVKSMGGEATNIGALEWDALSDGKPTYTPAA